MPQATCHRCGSRLQPAGDGTLPTCPTCIPHHDTNVETKTSAGDPPPAAHTDYRGKTFGSYKILEEISRGAMGVVYKARQQVLKRVVALKVLIAGDLATEAQVARFQREAQAAAKLRHPAIVPIHDVGVYDGKHYYTMDFIQGRPLSALVAAGEITPRRALDITFEVAQALDYAHAEGVIHRDIKPSNIMIDPEGGIHVMDFGLAKQIDSDTKFTRTGTTVGTPAYMPPEQASGESRRVDHRADIYSLGAVLYEMLTGRPPFSGDTMMATLMHVLNDDPTAPKRLNPRIHRDIQTIVLKAMEKNPDRRYRSMGELASDIHHFIGGEAIAARPASLVYRAWKGFKKHRSAVFAAASVLLIGLTAYAVIQQERDRMSERLKEVRKDVEREVTKKTEREREEMEKPTVKTVFADRFDRGRFRSNWHVERGRWRAQQGTLEAFGGPLAAVRTQKTFTGDVKVRFAVSVPAAARSRQPTKAVVGCYLGMMWHQSFRIWIDGRQRWRLVLMNRHEEVAEVECPPLDPDVPYQVTVSRSAIGLHVLVESRDGAMRRELSYNDLQLPQRLGRDFAVGLFTEGSRLQVHEVVVEQEFSPLKTTPLRTADELFRDGNFLEARSVCEKIAQGYPRSYEGLEAQLRIARSWQIEHRDLQARQILDLIQRQAARVSHEKLPELVARTNLHQFFVNARLNHFDDAVKALERLAQAGGYLDEAWVWRIPDHLRAMIANLAYDETLRLLNAPVFGTGRKTLHGLVSSLHAPTIQNTLASRARLLAEGFCDHAQGAKVKDVYAAYPTPLLADAFARAITQALRRDERDGALDFLKFAADHQLGGPGLTQAAVELATSFHDADLYDRLADVYAAYPDAKLAPVFERAVRKATDAGQLDAALRALQLCARSFPDEAERFLAPNGTAIRLGKAFLARGDLLKPKDVHGVFGPGSMAPGLVALFVEATQRAIDGGKPDAALELLQHCRDNLGVLHAGLAAAAGRLVDYHTGRQEFKQAAAAYQAYRNEAVAPAAARAIAAAADAGQLAGALALFVDYAKSRHPLPRDAVARLARALAEREPALEATRTLLSQYSAVCGAYESPAAQSAMLLALGDAYVRAGGLASALEQYATAGDAEGHVRAACVALELGRIERAVGEWQTAGELAADGAPWRTVGAFMLGQATAAELRAAAAPALPTPFVHYLTGLRLWTESSPATDAFTKASGGKPDWFTPLASRRRPPFAPAIEDTP